MLHCIFAASSTLTWSPQEADISSNKNSVSLTTGTPEEGFINVCSFRAKCFMNPFNDKVLEVPAGM